MPQLPSFAAMVLSAGFGTRLHPLTKEIPKPLVPVGDRPLLELVLKNLHEEGAAELVINAHHQTDKMMSFIKGLSFDVHVSSEEKILGTAGGIAGAAGYFGGRPLLLVNGDIVGELPLAELLPNPTPGLRLAVAPRQVGEGTVGIGSSGQVVRLRGETFGEEVSSGDYMGVAQLGALCIESLPKEGCLIGDWALPHLRAGGVIETVVARQGFRDVGTPEEYLSANLAWLDDREGESEGQVYLGPNAEIAEGVSLQRSLIGAGAAVVGEGVVEDCVVLPGARASAPLSHSIVTPSGAVMSARRG